MILNWLNALTFRSKLSLLLILLLGGCAASMLGLAQYFFRHHIENFVLSQLHQERQVLVQTMRKRGEILYREAHGVAARISKAGWLERQAQPISLEFMRKQYFLPADSITEVMVVMRAKDNVVTASSRLLTDRFVTDLQKYPALHEVWEGSRRAFWLYSGKTVYQLTVVIVPGEPVGAVFLAHRLAWQEMPLFSLYSGQTGFAVFDTSYHILASYNVPPTFSNEELAALFTTQADFTDQPVMIGGGRHHDSFVYLVDFDTLKDIPPFILLRTMSESSSFVWNARWFILLILLVFISITLFFIYLFNHHIHYVLNALLTTMEQMERENYAHRLELPRNDDFNELTQSVNEMMHTLEEQDVLHKAMEQVVSRDTAQRILNGRIKPDGEARELTVLTVNIRGFSEISSHFATPDLLKFLNDYFTRLYYCVEAHEGLMDKFQGDTLIALFGFEDSPEKGLRSAMASAQDMLDAVALFNLEVAEPHDLHIDSVIGIAWGTLITGTIGAFERRTYSVIGNPVKHAFQALELASSCGVSIVLDADACQLFAHSVRDDGQELLARALNSVLFNAQIPQMECCEILPRRYRPEELADLIREFEAAQTDVSVGFMESALSRLAILAEKWPEDRPTQILLQYCQNALNPDSEPNLSSVFTLPARGEIQ